MNALTQRDIRYFNGNLISYKFFWPDCLLRVTRILLIFLLPALNIHETEVAGAFSVTREESMEIPKKILYPT